MSLQTKKYYYTYLILDVLHVFFRGFAGHTFITVAITLHFLGRKKQCAKYLMTANRFAYSPISTALFKKYKLLSKYSLLPHVSTGVTIDDAAGRSIVIRWPRYNDKKIESKGILIIKFTYIFSYYLRHINIESLTEHFNIVLEPSWSGYFDSDILYWAITTKQPVFVEATELLDRITINSLNSNLIPLSFGSSDWVDYKSFHTKDIDKQYDSLYVANTSQVKRIIRYMKSIKNICANTDPDYKGCLVCATWGENEETIRSLPGYFGIENNIKLHFSLNKEALNDVINLSKVNILLSYKEGSNRSLFESMFTNIPVLCIAENIGVNKSYINEHTGLLIFDHLLEDGLLHMKENWKRYRPREWALKNISPEKTTKKLLSVIKTWDSASAEVNATYVKTNNPEMSYLDYQSIEFFDINKDLLVGFKTTESKRCLESEINSVTKCQNTFLMRAKSQKQTSDLA